MKCCVNRRSRLRLNLVWGVILGMLPSAALAQPATAYTIVDVGPAGSEYSSGELVAENGDVVGQMLTENFDIRAYLYSNGQTVDLTLGGPNSTATAVNNRGEVAGYAQLPSGYQHAFLYSNGSLTDLGTLGGNESFAYGINTDGAVVGTSATPVKGPSHAFLYANGEMVDLNDLLPADSGWVLTEARDINDNGTIVGLGTFKDLPGSFIYYPDGSIHLLRTTEASQYGDFINDNGDIAGQSKGSGFLYSQGRLIELSFGPLLRGAVRELNASGQVTGFSQAPDVKSFRAFLYSNGAMIDLGTVGELNSSGEGINDDGDVVGVSVPLKGRSRAFLYSGGVMTDLNDLLPVDSGWVLEEAFDINNRGQITGRGILNDRARAFLLTPVSNASPTAMASISVPGQEPATFVEAHCTGPEGVSVTLDGRDSSDPDDDGLDYEWTVSETSGATIDNSTASSTTATFPVGMHEITLTVYDVDGAGVRKGGLDCTTVTLVVVDDEPPVALVTTDLEALWPANNKLVPVRVTVLASDLCTGPADLLLRCTISSNQPDDTDGTGQLAGDVNGRDGHAAPAEITLQNMGDGTYTALVPLRAERDGEDRGGRVYSVRVEAIDGSGNLGEASTTVVVPHSQGRKS